MAEHQVRSALPNGIDSTTIRGPFARPGRVDLVASASLAATYLWKIRSGFGPDGWHADDAWVASAVSFSDSPAELIRTGFTHPGFSVLLRALSSGPTDTIALQIVPVMGAVAAICVMYAVVRHVVHNRFVAWLCLLPFASSYLLARYSLALKPYTLEILAFAVALFVLQRIPTVTNRDLVLWMAIIVPVATLSFRISFVSAVAGFGVYWAGRMTLRQLIGLGAAHAVLLGPMLLFMQSNFNNEVLTNWWRARPGVFDVEDEAAVVTLWKQFHRVTRVIWDAPSAIGWLLVVLVIVGALDAVLSRRAAGTASAGGLVLAMLLSLLELSPFGPQQLGNQRIDMWLAAALLLLAVEGALLILRPLLGWFAAREPIAIDPRVALAATGVALAIMVLAPLVVTDLVDDRVYPDENLDQNLAFALHELQSAQAPVLVGPDHNGVELQVAAFDPSVVVDLVPEPDNMRGLVIELNPPMVRLSTLVAGELPPETDRVVGVRIGQGAEARFRSYLRDAGFVRAQNPTFPLIEVWDRAD